MKEKMPRGKNLANMAVRAGQLKLRASQLEHGKAYFGVIGREVDSIAYRIDICRR